MRNIFPEVDKSTKDLARFFFFSPDDAEYRCSWDNDFLNIDEIKEVYNLKDVVENSHDKVWEFNDDLEITLADGRTVHVCDVTEKQPCRCPLPEHDDNNPSAFV